MASEHEMCVVYLRGSKFVRLDSTVVWCHRASPSGMLLSPGIGCGASLVEPQLPVPCQSVLATAHLKSMLGKHRYFDSFQALNVFLALN